MHAVPLFSSPLLTVREVRCDAPRGGDCGDEWADAPSIAIPLRGCFAVDRARSTVVADANTAIFFEPAVPYRVAHPADEGDVSFVIAYEPGLPFRATHAHVVPSEQLLVRLFRSSLIAGITDALDVEERAFSIVARLAGARPLEPNTRQSITVERAKAFLGERFRDPVSLGAAAQAAGTSPFTLARAFPAVTGLTTHRYLVALRLAAALDALAAGATSLSHVAVDAGFAHHSHLTKAFARTFGMTPRSARDELTASSRTSRRRRWQTR